MTWPVVLDGNYAIWKRYNNNIWPRELLYDQSGHLVESVSGEGGYQQTEAKIQGLLKQDDQKIALPPIMALLLPPTSTSWEPYWNAPLPTALKLRSLQVETV